MSALQERIKKNIAATPSSAMYISCIKKVDILIMDLNEFLFHHQSMLAVMCVCSGIPRTNDICNMYDGIELDNSITPPEPLTK